MTKQRNETASKDKQKHIRIKIKRPSIFLQAQTFLTHKAHEILTVVGICNEAEERGEEEHYIFETDDDSDYSDRQNDGGRLRHSFIKRQWEELDRQNLMKQY
jgi:hypothetical protein